MLNKLGMIILNAATILFFQNLNNKDISEEKLTVTDIPVTSESTSSTTQQTLVSIPKTIVGNKNLSFSKKP